METNERFFFVSVHFRHIYMKSSCKVFALQNFIILLVNSMPSVWKSHETISLFVSLTLFCFFLFCSDAWGIFVSFFSIHGKCTTLSLSSSSSSSHSYRKMAHERKYIFLPVNTFNRCCVFSFRKTIIIFAVFNACSFNTFGFSLVWHFLFNRRKLFNYLLFPKKHNTLTHKRCKRLFFLFRIFFSR